MNEDGYRIIHVGDGYDNYFGEIVIVRANPIYNNGFRKYYTPYESSDTELFFFPNNEDIIDRLVQISKGGGVWYPDEEEYEEDSVLIEKQHKLIYRHLGFYIDDYKADLNSGRPVCLISDMLAKINTLKVSYYNGSRYTEYGSFRSFVESLAEGDIGENFWGWLFNRPDLNGLLPWQLPGNYYSEYERFLASCS